MVLLQGYTSKIKYITKREKKQLSITFHLKNLLLKVFQYSFESVIVLYFEGILFFWF